MGAPCHTSVAISGQSTRGVHRAVRALLVMSKIVPTSVAVMAVVSRPTVTRGVVEARAGGVSPELQGRVRKPGGGRKSLTQTDPGIVAALDSPG